MWSIEEKLFLLYCAYAAYTWSTPREWWQDALIIGAFMLGYFLTEWIKLLNKKRQ